MVKRIWRSAAVQRAMGALLAGYLMLVWRTTRWRTDDAARRDASRGDMPIIISTWHGQHFLVPLMRPDFMPASVLISRHGDGEMFAIAAERMGLHAIRGSGGHGSAAKTRKRGGAAALRALLATLADGRSTALTADVPKVAGEVGEGIVLLARLSGRPIYPCAAVTRARVTLPSWDRATLAFPFSRGGWAVGEPLTVPREADEAALAAARGELALRLDETHARAYALAGGGSWRRAHA